MAAQPVSARFHAVLERHRERLNERFARRGRTLDAAAFLRYLRDTVDPLVEGAGDAAEAAALALFEFGFVASERGWLGAEQPSDLERTLVASLPRFGAHWLDAPVALLRIVGNGYERMMRALDGERACRWIEACAALAPSLASREEILDAGLVLAWKAGLAEARDAALARSAARTVAFRRATLGAEEVDARPERRFVPPDAAPTVRVAARAVTRVGGFLGFGGPFRVPPHVLSLEGRIVATDGSTLVELHADVFGARLVPAGWALDRITGEAAPAPTALCHAEAGARSGFTAAFALLASATSVASANGMAAATFADTHDVMVIGLAPEART